MRPPQCCCASLLATCSKTASLRAALTGAPSGHARRFNASIAVARWTARASGYGATRSSARRRYAPMICVCAAWSPPQTYAAIASRAARTAPTRFVDAPAFLHLFCRGHHRRRPSHHPCRRWRLRSHPHHLPHHRPPLSPPCLQARHRYNLQVRLRHRRHHRHYRRRGRRSLPLQGTSPLSSRASNLSRKMQPPEAVSR